MPTITRCFLLMVLAVLSQTSVAQTIASGHMPNMVTDGRGVIHLVYGTGDSIMYTRSADGKTFSNPELVAELAGVFASAMRGPQIALSNQGVTIIGCTKSGNIFSYTKNALGKWSTPTRVNKQEETAKEALIALSGSGKLLYAAWLSVKPVKGQEVFGAYSTNGGHTWTNVLVYTSPGGTVCECCKPSVLVHDNQVAVMFRNFLNNSRDLYLAQSADGGKTFKTASKLGKGTWPLKGCPMDGGGLALDSEGNLQTVWRRDGTIYTATPGKTEVAIAEGKNCTIATVSAKSVYAFNQNGTITVVTPNGAVLHPGKGNLPVLSALNNHSVLCVWEQAGKIESAVIEI